MSHDLHALYSDSIRAHSRAPRGTTLPEPQDGRASCQNPLCGDQVEVALRIREGSIDALGHQTRGCALCIAAASMMAERVIGLPVHSARALAAELDGLLRTGEVRPALGESNAFAAAARFPMRQRCVQLPWETLLAALARHEP